MSKILFVIGNGKSREHFDCNQLKKHGKVIVCNMAYKDINADAVSINNKYLSMKSVIETPIISVPEPDNSRDIYWDGIWTGQLPNHLIRKHSLIREWNSGQVAIIAGIKKYKPDEVFLIGFDFFDIPDPKLHWQKQKSNNMYHKCHNERPQDIEKIYNWIVEENRDIKFYRIGPLGDPILDKLLMVNITYEGFNNWIRCRER